jgi:hypothetical protein
MEIAEIGKTTLARVPRDEGAIEFPCYIDVAWKNTCLEYSH